jgi:peptidoglycan/xylan/chitin deacetylase (PgdA/CDA1 family)
VKYSLKIMLVGLGFVMILGLLKSQLYTMQTFAGEDSEISRVIYVVDSNLSRKLITNVDTDGQKLVALTLDDGPDPLYTTEVLNILKRYQVKATFFVVGENVEAYPALVKQAVDAGHEIENHTYTHPDLSQVDDIGTEQEIRKTEALLDGMLGSRTKYFRPPRKLFRSETIEIAQRYGYKTVLWTICVENTNAKTPQVMAARVIGAARPGMIILAHDGRLDRSKTMLALPIIIEAFQKQGYQFVTLDELFKQQTDGSATQQRRLQIEKLAENLWEDKDS